MREYVADYIERLDDRFGWVSGEDGDQKPRDKNMGFTQHLTIRCNSRARDGWQLVATCAAEIQSGSMREGLYLFFEREAAS